MNLIVKPGAVCLAFALLSVACGDEDLQYSEELQYSEDVEYSEDSAEMSDSGSDDGAQAEADAGHVDASLDRDDVDCSAEGLGSSSETDFSTANVVVGGSLGAACLGKQDATLVAAWEALATITPPLQLADLALFGGFAVPDDSDEVTLAFVNVIDDEGSAFQMSINLQAFNDDADEALLTMAHEFSHVFTGLSTQLDRSDEAFDSCDTYLAADGCYRQSSLMYQWIQEFWGGGLIEQIDPYEEASGAEGQERCDLNAGFFGAYAASNPEEDFAESFAAMVMRVEASTPEQQSKLDWLSAQPGLVEFRERAVAAAVGPLANTFDECGYGQ